MRSGIPFWAALLFVVNIFLPLRSQNKKHYPFIKYELNQLVLPKDSSTWISLGNKLTTLKEGKNKEFVVLHIGDSHIQGDYFTGEIRKQLFEYAGTKIQSRGISFPYPLISSNGPDELIYPPSKQFEGSSIRRPKEMFYPLTGYCIEGGDSSYSFTLKDTAGYRFNQILLYHSPTSISSLTINKAFPASTTLLEDSTAVSLFQTEDFHSEFELQVKTVGRAKPIGIFGFSLQNTDNKILYHSVGINGATFGTFLKMDGVKEMLQHINPDCIVISYGTNDALDRNLDSTRFKKQVSTSIAILKEALPAVPLIFTTPGDHLLNKKYLNRKLPVACNIIKQTAIVNNCAYWDFFNVMGGNNSIGIWYKNQLAYRDFIHLSKTGYKLQGDLFFSAFIKLAK